MKHVNYRGWNCQVKFARYQNDPLAIQLKTDLGTPVARATLNLSYVPLEADEVLVKSFDENEGLLECLVEAKVVEPTGMKIRVGENVVHVCELLDFDEAIASLE